MVILRSLSRKVPKTSTGKAVEAPWGRIKACTAVAEINDAIVGREQSRRPVARRTAMAATPGGAAPDLPSLVASLAAALLPCLPAWELQVANHFAHPSHQVDVERHAADFMEAAKTLQLYFVRVQHQHQSTREEALRKEIAGLEAELKAKDSLLEKQNNLLQHWQSLLEAQKNIHIQELERV